MFLLTISTTAVAYVVSVEASQLEPHCEELSRTTEQHDEAFYAQEPRDPSLRKLRQRGSGNINLVEFPTRLCVQYILHGASVENWTRVHI